MIHTTMAYITGCNNPHCRAHRRTDLRMKLELQYTDEKNDVELTIEVKSLPAITIRQITEDLLKFLYLDDIPPEEVRLVGFSCGGSRRRLDVTDKEMKLQDLGVTDGCILYFEPIPTAAPLKSCQLTIIGPDEVKKIDYQWYRAKTTLGMLLKFVIEQFSLQSVERERIHLLTIFAELDFFSCSDQQLAKFDLHSGMSVYVQIIPSLSSTTDNENKNVHVECSHNNDKYTLDVPNTKTISELKTEIEKRFKDRQIIDFKLYNATNDELTMDDSDRILQTFGVKPGQTIFATFRLIAQNAQPSLVNNQSKASTKSSSSLKTKQKYDIVTIICDFPSNNPETFQILVNKTVGEVIDQVETRASNRRLVISKMYSSNIKIDFKNERYRCLADLGFKQEDIINVTLIDKSPTHSSIVSRRSASDKLSKTHRINKTPIGLDNLGNSCYMNSALQCLVHIPQLTKIFLENLHHTHMDDGEHTDDDWNPYDKVGDVTGAYAELLWYLWKCDQNDDNDDSFKPNRIKEKIGNKDSRFATDDQQDAQEFMTFFLDAIHEELKAKDKNQENTIIKELFFGKITSTITCTECNKKESTTHPISFLSIPLERQERKYWINFISKKGKDELVSVDVPISGRVENVVDEFSESYGRPSLFYYILPMIPDGELDFQTPLSEVPTDEFIFMEQEERLRTTRPQRLKLSQKKSTLENCLADFFSAEQLEDSWTCPQETCKKKTLATKQLKLSTPPTVLIIQFKRFSHENGFHQKVETFVKYPIEGLYLNKCLPSLEEDAIYDLIAVSNHMGSISGGHYTAYARHTILNKNEWYKFDDSCVTHVQPQDYNYDIVSRNAYLLFYIKREISNLETIV